MTCAEDFAYFRSMADFNDYLTRCVGLSEGTAYNYASAAGCIQNTATPEGGPWPEKTPPAVWEYIHSRGISWRRTIDAAWKHYRDYCGVEGLTVPPTLEGPASDEMPDEALHAVRRLLSALGIQAVQRLRWSHVGTSSEWCSLFDHQGSLLTRSRSIPQVQLLEILGVLHSWGVPTEPGSPLVPDTPGSLMGASRRRLREIEKKSRDLQVPEPPPIPPVIPKQDGIRAQILPGGFAAPPAAALASANLGVVPSLLGDQPVGASTGRSVQSQEEVEATLQAKSVPAHMAIGVQAEVTGTYPDDDDD